MSHVIFPLRVNKILYVALSNYSVSALSNYYQDFYWSTSECLIITLNYKRFSVLLCLSLDLISSVFGHILAVNAFLYAV